MDDWESTTIVYTRTHCAVLQVDGRLLRRNTYRQYWMDKENEKYAHEIHGLLMPAYQHQREQQLKKTDAK